MKTITISTSYSRKINPELINPERKYESFQIEQSTYAELDEGESPDEVQKKLHDFCKQCVRLAARDTIEKFAKDARSSRISLRSALTAFEAIMRERDNAETDKLVESFRLKVLQEEAK